MVCGLTNEKPAFVDHCPDFEAHAESTERIVRGGRKPKGAPPFKVPVGLHSFLTTVLAFAGGLVVMGVTLLFILNTLNLEEPGVGKYILLGVMVLSFGAGYHTVLKLMRLYIAGTCPVCTGWSYRVADRPVTFECWDCGYLNVTNYSEGGDP